MCRKKSQQVYYDNMFTECKNDLKSPWKLIQEVTCSRKMQKDTLPEYFCYCGNIVRSPQDIANNFNKYFIEVGPKLVGKILKTKNNLTDFLGAPNIEHFK